MNVSSIYLCVCGHVGWHDLWSDPLAMLEALSLIMPLFAIMGLGYALMRWGFMSRANLDGFEVFIFNIAIPALLFRTMRGVDLPSMVPLHLWSAYYGGALIVCIVCFAFSFLFLRRHARESVAFSFSSANANTVLLGVPIILSAFGHDAALPLFLILSIHGLLLMGSETVILQIVSTKSNGRKRAILKTLGHSLWKAVRAPVIMSLGGGLVYGLVDGPWPYALDRGFFMVGQSAIPGALFLMGALLARYDLRGTFIPAFANAIFKTGLHPALVYCLGAYVFALPPVALATATLMAALPSGLYTFILANQFNAAPQTASLAILLSTLISLATLPLLISFFTHLTSTNIHSLAHP